MYEVQDVGECVVHGLWHERELAQQCVFGHSVRLRHDQIIAAREQIKRVL